MNIRAITRGLLLGLVLTGLHTSVPAENNEESWEKVVFHVDEVGNARWAILLANSYLQDRPNAKIVFVTYGPGIDFLLKGAEDRRGNSFEPAVSKLSGQGVDFRICAATLDARTIARDALLDTAKVVPSGISELTRLQLREGYAYLKP